MNFRREKISRHDGRLFRDEMVEQQDARSEQERSYYEAIQDINQIIKEMTAELYISVNEYINHPYTFQEMKEKIEQTERIFKEISGIEIESNDRAFAAAAIIRYVDDFLDNYAWGYVRNMGSLQGDTYTYSRNKFVARYRKMIERFIQVAQKYDAWMPDSIGDLPLLEMEFELNPTQEFFDNHIGEYIDRKAYDLMYLLHLLSKGAKTGNLEFATQEELDEYRMYAMYDVQRDIANEDSYDFDIFRHIRVHNLRPEVLQRVVADIIRNGNDKVKNDHIRTTVLNAQSFIETM